MLTAVLWQYLNKYSKSARTTKVTDEFVAETYSLESVGKVKADHLPGLKPESRQESEFLLKENAIEKMKAEMYVPQIFP